MARILDTTLREGKQSIEGQKLVGKELSYATLAYSFGIRDIEIINPRANVGDMRSFRQIKKALPKMRIWIHSPIRTIGAVIADNLVSNISTFIHAKDIKNDIKKLRVILEKNPLKNFRVAVERIADADKRDLAVFIKLANDHKNLKRICISDTRGAMDPGRVKELTSFFDLKLSSDKELEFHLHNDRGLCAANAISALRTAPASRTLVFDASLSGMGERNGILSLGDILAIECASSTVTFPGIKTMIFGKIAEFREKNNIRFDRDPLGRNAFNHFAASHIVSAAGISAYEYMPAVRYGMPSTVILSRYSSTESIAKALSISMKRAAKLKPKLKKVVFIKNSERKN